MSNYTASHESKRCQSIGGASLAYANFAWPDNHIEVDNRLTYFLGTLGKQFGDNAFYVHLVRDRCKVAESLAKRGPYSILFAYAAGVLQYRERAHWMSGDQRFEIALHYWDAINANIEMFLRDKSRKCVVRLESAKEDFGNFWTAIGASGDLQNALKRWDRHYNHSLGANGQSWLPRPQPEASQAARIEAALHSHIPSSDRFVLIDNDEVRSTLSIARERCLPFPSTDGEWTGLPEDSGTAIDLLSHEIKTNQVRHVAIARTAFWWLEHYTGLASFLIRRGTECLRNEDLIIITLRDDTQSTTNASPGGVRFEDVTKAKDLQDSYWQRRKRLRYYSVLKQWMEDLGPRKSILDVGGGGTPLPTWGCFQQRMQLDIRPATRRFNGVEAIQDDWLEFELNSPVNVITCCQVLEHLDDSIVRRFAQKILDSCELAIVSVPYRWPKGACRFHKQDPVTFTKVIEWLGDDIVRSTIVTEDGVEGGMDRRLILQLRGRV